MKLSDTTVRWYDVVFVVVFPMAFNLLFGLSGVEGSSLGGALKIVPLFLLMMSYFWFMQKREQAHSDSNSDGDSP